MSSVGMKGEIKGEESYKKLLLEAIKFIISQDFFQRIVNNWQEEENSRETKEVIKDIP